MWTKTKSLKHISNSQNVPTNPTFWKKGTFHFHNIWLIFFISRCAASGTPIIISRFPGTSIDTFYFKMLIQPEISEDVLCRASIGYGPMFVGQYIKCLDHKHVKFEFWEKCDLRFGPLSKIRFLFMCKWRYELISHVIFTIDASHWSLSDVCII